MPGRMPKNGFNFILSSFSSGSGVSAVFFEDLLF